MIFKTNCSSVAVYLYITYDFLKELRLSNNAEQYTLNTYNQLKVANNVLTCNIRNQNTLHILKLKI